MPYLCSSVQLYDQQDLVPELWRQEEEGHGRHKGAEYMHVLLHMILIFVSGPL